MRPTLALTLLLSGCSSVTLTPEAEKVRIVEHREDLDRRCKVTGQLEASASQFGPPEYLLLHDDDAKKKLLNLAAKKGDTLYIYQSDSGLFGSNYKAYVLQCGETKKAALAPKEPAPVPAPAAAPAAILPAPSAAPVTEATAPSEVLPEPTSLPLPEAAPPSQ